MDGRDKEHLSKKMLELLTIQGRTQVELADFAGVQQGLVADHIRGKAYPKLKLLIKYAKFFRVSLYELTGIAELKGNC